MNATIMSDIMNITLQLSYYQFYYIGCIVAVLLRLDHLISLLVYCSKHKEYIDPPAYDLWFLLSWLYVAWRLLLIIVVMLASVVYYLYKIIIKIRERL